MSSKNLFKLNKKMVLILLMIVLVVSITPVCAIHIEEVAHEAGKYNEESQKKRGFFAKIKFMVKGFKLVSKAKTAEKETNAMIKNKNNDKSEQEKFNSVPDQIINSLKTKKNLINFRNSKKNSQSNTNTITTPANGTNTPNISTIMSTQNSEDFVIPAECQNSADHIIQLLNNQSKTASQITQKEINTELNGHIVQLIDEKGFIRYVYVKNIVLCGKNPQVVIYHGNTEKTLSLDEFKKSYSGITFNLNSCNSPEEVVDTIISLQKKELKNQENTIKRQKEKSMHQIIINVLLIALGVVLAVTGAFIATYFGKQLASRFNEIKNIREFNLVNNLDQSLGKYKIQGDITGGACEINEINTKRSYSNTQDKFAGLDLLIDEEDYTYYIAHQMVYFIQNNLMSEFTAYVAQRTAEGCIIIGASTLEILGYVASENWIKVVVCSIGLFIFLAGIILTIYAGYITIKYLLLWLEYKEMLKINENNISVLNTWLAAKQGMNTNYTTPMNTTTGTKNNQTAAAA